MKVHIIRACHFNSGRPNADIHFYLVCDSNVAKAEIKVRQYLRIISPHLEVDPHWYVGLEIDSIPNIESLDGRDGSKCYYARKKVNDEFVGKGWIITAKTHFQARIEVSDYETEGEIIISALPKINDIIM